MASASKNGATQPGRKDPLEIDLDNLTLEDLPELVSLSDLNFDDGQIDKEKWNHLLDFLDRIVINSGGARARPLRDIREIMAALKGFGELFPAEELKNSARQ